MFPLQCLVSFSSSVCRLNVNLLCLACLSHMDVMAAAEWGEYLLTSPNMAFIPEPPPPGKADLVLDVDGWFGYYDYMVYPQWLPPHEHHLQFLACIPRKLVRSSIDTMDKVFGWFPSDTLARRDFGQFADPTFDQLTIQATSLLPPLQAAAVVLQRRGDAVFSNHVQSVSSRIHDSLTLLQSPTRKDIALLAFRELQRNVLTAQGILNCAAQGQILQSLPSQSDQRVQVQRGFMGAFVWTGEDAKSLFEAGIPVWWARHKTTLDSEVLKAHSTLCKPAPTALPLLLPPFRFYNGDILPPLHFKAEGPQDVMWYTVCSASSVLFGAFPILGFPSKDADISDISPKSMREAYLNKLRESYH